MSKHKELILENGNIYKGEVNNRGEPHGIGTLEYEEMYMSSCAHTYMAKTKYIGSFINGKQHGKGVVHHPAGYITEGEWEDGKYKPEVK